MVIGNILDNVPSYIPAESVEVIAESSKIRVERIISHGHCSPAGFWYDQDQHEWVILLQGSACLSFMEGEKKILKLGDYLNIPSHVKHRVEWTDSSQATIWLAVHYSWRLKTAGTPEYRHHPATYW